jgi:hypothetical protein
LIAKGGGVLGRAERVEEAAVGGHRGGDLEDEGAGVVGAPRLPAGPGRPERPRLQIREAHRRLIHDGGAATEFGGGAGRA